MDDLDPPVRPADPRERIIATATRLFAALGYDGTSTRLIAATAGLNVATVAYHVGSKRDLYLTVMERAHQAERAVLAAHDGVTDVPGLRRLLDAYIDFCVERPEVPALWVHRWQSDAADIADLEGRYALPLVNRMAALVRAVAGDGGAGDDVDAEYAVMTIVWCTHGFCRGGVPDAAGRRGIDRPAEVRRFRAHVHRLVDRMLGLR
ncbi:putative DNA-binding transcriptional regulator [Actinomadura rubteroloni]|uniref:Putative DNA-binding transcriptional regulator n=1 Tax=Actinomadura rubteroloni TaxID=1926885 RepID=A0A2P4UR14_9ACTN|nr:TetR/AcrR family transcriptional regulator [Actinomadura rubteroloni]POM27487.1 putative DNA-binding transcriptional regulator [Actinomadura rubteroloni]